MGNLGINLFDSFDCLRNYRSQKMTPQQIEALKLALEALKSQIVWFSRDTMIGKSMRQKTEKAITALEEALAEQEPVAWATKEDFHRELERRLKHIREEMKIKSVTMRCKDYDIALPIIDTDFGRVLVGQVSTPPQRTWVGLTEDEREQHRDDWQSNIHDKEFQAIEAKLKEKNT